MKWLKLYLLDPDESWLTCKNFWKTLAPNLTVIAAISAIPNDYVYYMKWLTLYLYYQLYLLYTTKADL